MSKVLNIYTDGGSRGNPGIAGVGIYVTDENGEPLYSQAKFLGVKTNNESEYMGFLLSAEWLKNEFLEKKEILWNQKKSSTFPPQKIEWYLDSKLVVEQLNKRWKIKEARLLELAKKCWNILDTLPHPIEIQHIPRAQNAHADALANEAMDSGK